MSRNDKKDLNFMPLSLTRPIEDLRCGVVTIGEKKRNHPIEYIWDLIKHLKEDLAEDIRDGKMERWGDGKRPIVKAVCHPSVVILNQEEVVLEEGVEIEPCAVLDARQGPIYIGQGTIIKAHANLRGPLYIGPGCRIGGEVSHSIFHGYSNKAHYGFIGHSYIGEWVNLGAGTTNSNLKNTYGTVKVQIGKKEIDTGLQFCGCFIGDHAKTGIGTLITTGAIIGVAANVFGGGVTKKVVKSFSWGANKKYDLEKALATMKLVMKRRGKVFSAAQEKQIRHLYENTIS
ncbi:MAG: hypothetical protein ABH823_00320 [bacterium]